MNLDEFLSFRDVKIRDKNHERIVRMFFPFLQSVCGVSDALPKIISKILDNIVLSSESIVTGCFNGITDGTTAPYGTPDFYIKFHDMTRVFVYGKDIECERACLKNNEYVLFALSDKITNHIENMGDKHFYMKE